MTKELAKEVALKFSSYPTDVAVSLRALRKIIYNVAKQEKIADLQETLKWGELSYVCKSGSTVRYDWKKTSPDRLFVYFNCKTSLVETFKEIYGEIFEYEGNRAISFSRGKVEFPLELGHCISMALKYHLLKHAPLLGA